MYYLNVTGLLNRCGGVLIDPRGTLIPMFGSSTIPVSCYWKIIAIDSHIVVLDVLSMDIRESESCLDQFIKVYIVTLQIFCLYSQGPKLCICTDSLGPFFFADAINITISCAGLFIFEGNRRRGQIR